MAAKVVKNQRDNLAIRLWWKNRQSWEGDVMGRGSLSDTRTNRAWMERIATAVTAEMRATTFTATRYAFYFPFGNRKDELKRASIVVRGEASRTPTVREFYERWIERVRAKVEMGEVRLSLLEDYEQHFLTYLLDEIGHMRLSDVQPGDLEELKVRLARMRGLGRQKRGLSMKTIKNIIAGSLKAMFRDAMQTENLVTTNPCKALTWKNINPEEDPDPFEAEERDAILGWFKKNRPYYFPFVFTLFWTGMRTSEAAGLLWGDVDLQRGLIFIRRSYSRGRYGAPKTRKRPADPTGRAARRLLKEVGRERETAVCGVSVPGYDRPTRRGSVRLAGGSLSSAGA